MKTVVFQEYHNNHSKEVDEEQQGCNRKITFITISYTSAYALVPTI